MPSVWDFYIAELYKFFKGNTFFVLLIIGIAFIAIQAIPFGEMVNLNLGEEIYEIAPLPAGYDAIAQGGINGLLPFFVPFLIVFFFTSEFSKKTFYNLLGQKISKEKIFISKYCVFSIVTLILSVALSAFSILFFILLRGWGSQFSIIHILDIALLIIRMTLFHVSSATIIIILSIFLRNSSIVVILFFAINIFDTLIAGMGYFIQEKITFVGHLIKLLPSKFATDFLQMSVSAEIMASALMSIFLSISLCLGISIFCLKRFDIL